MSQSPGRICVAHDATGLRVRLEGRGTSHGCPALRQWLEAELAAGIRHVRIDLASCTHLDSTFVGTLLFLAKHPQFKEGGLVLLRPSAECLQVLKQMCVVRLFIIDDEALELSEREAGREDWTELAGELDAHSRQSFRETVVQAHEELAGVPSPLSDCFRQIAEAGKKELQAVHSADANGQ